MESADWWSFSQTWRSTTTTERWTLWWKNREVMERQDSFFFSFFFMKRIRICLSAPLTHQCGWFFRIFVVPKYWISADKHNSKPRWALMSADCFCHCCGQSVYWSAVYLLPVIFTRGLSLPNLSKTAVIISRRKSFSCRNGGGASKTEPRLRR